MIACMVAEEAEKTAKEADRVVTYIAAWEEAKAKVIELLYDIAVLEQKVADADTDYAAIQAELLKTATRMLEAEAALEALQDAPDAPNASAEIVAGISEVVHNHKSNAGKNFDKNPVGYMTFAFKYLEDRQADLRRAEDRIRDLEEQIQWHKDGGYWNPSHW